jgi:hypothetical protein
MRRGRGMAAALGCALACACVAAAPADDAAAFERAMDDYHVQRFGPAFEVLSGLADTGHAQAARIALLMSRHGLRLYGREFALDAARRERWSAVASVPPATLLGQR